MSSRREIVVRATLTMLCCLVAVSAAGGAGSAARVPSFSPGASLPVGVAPSAVVVGDFDGDGSPDLAVANIGHVDPEFPDTGYRSNLRILLNDGAGRFHMAPGSPFRVGENPNSIAVADFNRDGRLDVAVTSDSLRILLGDGTGRFGEVPGPPLQQRGSRVPSNAHLPPMDPAPIRSFTRSKTYGSEEP